jgi:copper chaperone CopZ
MDSEYTVTGMTCENCVAAVSAELGKLPTVQAVEVDLSSARVLVRSDAPLALDSVRAAVDAAGFELADA